MRVLITGGAGFLGSHCADHLLSLDARVLIIDNYATGRPENVPAHPNLSVVEGDIGNPDTVNRLFDEFRPDYVIHGAASYKDPDDWETDIRTNVLGTIHVVQAARRTGVRRFVYLQTALYYGKPLERPITLSHPIAPFTSYSVTKTAGEQYVVMNGLSYVSLRLANVYGPRLLTGPFPVFYKRLKAGQPCVVTDTRRDFIEVTDFIDLANTVLFDSDAVGCFNVSSGKDNAIRDIFDLMVDRLGISPDTPVDVRHPEKDDVESLLLDPSATEKTFDWKVQTTQDHGIDRLIAWYDEHGVDATYTHLNIGKEEKK